MKFFLGAASVLISIGWIIGFGAGHSGSMLAFAIILLGVAQMSDVVERFRNRWAVEEADKFGQQNFRPPDA